MFLATILSVILGWYVVRYFFVSSIKIAVVLLFISVGALTGLFIVKKLIFTNNSLLESIFHIVLFSSFLGPSLVLVDLGPISLFPYRILYMVIILLSFYYLIKQYNKGFSLSGENPIFMFFIFWSLYSLLSILWSKSLTDGLKDFIFLIMGIGLIFLVPLIYKSTISYIKFYYIWMIMHAFLVMIGLINHFLKIHLPNSRINAVAAYQKHIPTAVFTNENDYASYLAISIFFIVAFIHYSRSWLWKCAGLLLILISFYLILATSSRANILAVIISFLFWFLLMPKNRTRLKLIFMGFSLLPIIIILFPSKVLAAIQGILIQLESIFANQESRGGSVDIRINQLKNALIYFQESYGFGIGPGNARYYLENDQIFPVFTQTNIHNWWMEILVNYGFIIFTLYVLIFIFILWKLIRLQKRALTLDEKMISEALALGIFTFILASISPSSMMALTYTWVLMAFAVGYIYINRKRKKVIL